MTEKKFANHFTSVIEFLIGFTQEYSYNNFVDTHRFILTPNSRTADDHLNKTEIEILKTVNKFKNKLLTQEQVIKLLHQDNKVPIWINVEIYESTPNMTVFNLFFSRRFRGDSDLNYKADKYPPFHPLVPMPPDHLKIEMNGKFDINWKKRLDNSKKLSGLFKIFKQLFIRG